VGVERICLWLNKLIWDWSFWFLLSVIHLEIEFHKPFAFYDNRVEPDEFQDHVSAMKNI